MEIPQGKAWKIAENRTLKWGSSPPRAHRFNLIPAISDLYLSTYDDSRFLRQKRKTLIFFTFLVVTTTKSQKPK
jgi:hypothetical protein